MLQRIGPINSEATVATNYLFMVSSSTMASRSKVRGPTFAENLEVLISSLKFVVSVQLPVFRISEISLFLL